MLRPAPLAFAAALGLASAGCGGSHADARSAGTPAARTASAAPRVPPGHLARADVEKVLPFGPPWLLRRVVIEDVARDGKFVGWRLVALPDDWASIDLKPGDVVTKVNGVVIEKPDDLWTVWTSLATAPELRITYERDGSTREVAMPIDGAPSKNAAAAAAAAPPPPRQGGPRKGTIVIEEQPSGGAP